MNKHFSVAFQGSANGNGYVLMQGLLPYYVRQELLRQLRRIVK
jgi:hypothetical protein